MSGAAHIGCSGWIYKHWKDQFYSGVKQKDWLAHYASRFSTVEINSSFYRKPTAAAVRAWPERVPKGFRFSVKMWRGITHYRKLKDAGELLGKFMPIMNELPMASRGPLLMQLPGNLRKDAERLDGFLDELRAFMDRKGWQVAVEFRSPDWLGEDVYEVLDRHKAAICLADMPHCTVDRANDAPFVYMRRHGTWGTYDGSYTMEQIEADAKRIRSWVRGGREVWVYYNNDIGGHAVNNALSLKGALGSTEVRS